MSRRSTRTKKKRGAESEGGPETKGSKVVPGVRWEWEGDGGQWSAFSADHCKLLSDGLTSGESSVTLQVSEAVKMKIRFDAMTQTNVSTGWQRNIRCVPTQTPGNSGGPNVWEWLNDSGEWRTFSPVNQRLLSACRLCCVESVSLEVTPGNLSKIDLKAMKHDTESGGKKLSIRCSPLAVWEWENEHGQWISYDATVTKDLENTHTAVSTSTRRARKGRGQVSVKAAGRSYTVDVVKMEQTNDSTGVMRKVRRLTSASGDEGGSTDPTSSQATPTSDDITSDDITSDSKPSSTDAKPCSSDADSGPSTAHPEPTTSTDGNGHVTRKFQGGVPVDYVCSKKVGKAQVYSEAGMHWDATLNQTNLKNNNNKFYLLQLLVDSGTSRYSTWFRWGRVGKTGQHQFMEFGSDLEGAKYFFRKKFHDKTHNEWDERESFTKQPGKYDILEMDYKAITEEADGEEEVDAEEEEEEKEKPPESHLDPRLQALIDLICDVKAMEDTVIEMKYDPRKAPLGKLTTDQISSGYAALKRIDDCISRGQLGDRLIQACDQFYTRVPHDFGMRRPPIIRTKEEVKEKITLLETLGDIEIAMRVLRGGDKMEHPLDRHYHGLHCKLVPLDHDEDMFQLVEKYVLQTHAATHSGYTLTVQEVFEAERDGEQEQFKDVGNRQLLWHGSRLTNWVGILSQGLRVAPPEAPVTGYMFGKGVYFADMCSKSANYCFASRARQEGLLVLCDVSLGQTNDLLAADHHADQLPRGKHSTRGLGSVAPDPTQSTKLADGCLVPLGTSISTGVHNPQGYTLNYNEYVIYDTKQIKMSYLVRVKFNFK